MSTEPGCHARTEGAVPLSHSHGQWRATPTARPAKRRERLPGRANAARSNVWLPFTRPTGHHASVADKGETESEAFRPSEATRLRSLLLDQNDGLAICAISGAGGIGKSYLVEHVLSSLEPAKAGWMALRIDANQAQARGDFFALIDGQLARRSLPPPADPRVDYFPRTRRVAAAHRGLIARVAKDLERNGAPEDVRRAAIALLKAAHLLNKAIPKTREYVDIARFNLEPDAVSDGIDEAWDTIDGLKTLRDSEWLPEAVRDRLNRSLSSRLRRDLYGVTANAIVGDLNVALAGWVPEGSSSRPLRPIPGFDRLLLVVDDYEAVGPTLSDFLISSLIPRLAEAHFATMVVVAGRDDLEDTHPGWGQHCGRFFTEQIRLQPFDAETAAQLMAAEGVAEDRRAAIYELTQGFPLLLSLAIEEASADGASALFLKRFFDRTTRWMSGEERDWFVATCYLDEVNEDTLRLVLPDEDVGAVQDWFEGEASIRDPSAPIFRVRPLIREKVLGYIAVRSPERHRELSARAQAGNAT